METTISRKEAQRAYERRTIIPRGKEINPAEITLRSKIGEAWDSQRGRNLTLDLTPEEEELLDRLKLSDKQWSHLMEGYALDSEERRIKSGEITGEQRIQEYDTYLKTKGIGRSQRGVEVEAYRDKLAKRGLVKGRSAFWKFIH